MAKNFNTERPTQFATDAEYVLGKAQNITTAGDNTGSPWVADVIDDLILGPASAEMYEADLEPDGQEEKAGQSQRVKAKKIIAQDAMWGDKFVGTFKKGCTITAADQVVRGAPNVYWQWQGALPKVVSAGDVPGSPDYEQRVFSDHSNLSNRNAVGAHDEIYRRETDIASVTGGDFDIGSRLTITDRSNGGFDVSSTGTANGLDIISAGDGKVATLTNTDQGILSNWLFSAATATQTPIQRAIEIADQQTGNDVSIKSSTYELTGTVEVLEGIRFKSLGVSTTFDVDRAGATFNLVTAGDQNLVAFRLGSNTDTASNRAMQIESVKVIGATNTEGFGFRTIDRDAVPTAANSINWEIEKATAQDLLVGFDIKDSWNYRMVQTTAIGCDTGHRISGTAAGGGTSNTWDACLSYSCRIGFDFRGDGWSYSSMTACGSDNCNIGLRLGGASNRGSSIRNFGVEGIQFTTAGVDGFGVLVDYNGAGYYDIDGLHFAIHDNADITFIKVRNNRSIYFRSVDVPSSVIGASKFYEQDNTANAGSVYFVDSSIFGSNLGDIFESNVRLQNTNINGRLYVNAIGGFDSEPQVVTYTSGQASASNNQIFSKLMKASPDAAFDRIFTGTPIFDAAKLSDFDRFTIVNTSSTNDLIFRTETSLAGAGIVRDATLNPANDIRLENQGDSVTLEKRPDGNLYQIALFTN